MLEIPTHRYPILLSLAFILFITVLTIGQTVLFPFFTIDDSDLLNRAFRFFSENGWSSYYKAFEPGIASNRRYWPGFFIYTIFRYQLLGLNSVLWHCFQLVLIGFIGFMMAMLSHRLVSTIIPGLVSYCIILTAGDFSYQTNWFSYVFTNSFEPIIYGMLAVVLGLCLLYEMLTNSVGRWIIHILCIMLVIFTLTIKENVFLFMGGFALGLFILSFTRAGRFIVFNRTTLLIIMFFSGAWGLLVYKLIPKDSNYGGTSSLITNPELLWNNLKTYYDAINFASGFYIIGGLITGLIRIIKTKREWMAYLICLLFSILQILSVIIWPDISLRLIYPAFATLIFIATVEYCKLLSQIQMPLIRMPLISGLVSSVIVYLIVARLSEKAFETALTVGVCLGGYQYYATNPLQRSFHTGIIVPPFAILFAGIVVNGLCHTASYPTLYKATELTRHMTVIKAVQQTPANGYVIWCVPPAGEIFPYSCDIHAELFFNRADLNIIPVVALKTKEHLNAGDMFVLYGKSSSLDFQQDPRLQHFSVGQSGYISSILSYADYLKVVRSLARFEKPATPLSGYYEGVINVYKVLENNWPIDPRILSYRSGE